MTKKNANKEFGLKKKWCTYRQNMRWVGLEIKGGTTAATQPLYSGNQVACPNKQK